ncbi:unnamed protein product, partial [Prorocentrum cordatum]
DREIAQLKAQLKAASAPAVDEGANDAEDPQGRLAEIASLLRALGSSTDPAIMGAREALSKEREAIKLRIVEAKPFAGQLHHYTTRIDALVQAKDKRQAALQDLQEQRQRLDDRITETEGQIAEITAEVQELEALRWKVSAKAPTAAPGECSLRTLVPAVDISVEKMGEMLQGLGADDQLAQSVATVFSQLRALADKAAAAGSDAAPAPGHPEGDSSSAASPSGPANMPTEGQQQAAQDRPVPMDTDDLDELREFLRNATGEDPPQEEALVREAIKRMATAMETLQ